MKDADIYMYMKKAALPVLGVALLCHLVSFGSPHWGTTNYRATRSSHIGLWTYCTSGVKAGGGYGENCDQFIDIITHDWQSAAQSFMTLGMFSLVGTTVVFILFVVAPEFKQNFKVFYACWAASLITVLFIGLACLSFASKYSDYFAKKDPAFTPEVASLGWSFWLAVAVAMLTIIASSMITPDTYLALQEEAQPMRDIRKPVNA